MGPMAMLCVYYTVAGIRSLSTSEVDISRFIKSISVIFTQPCTRSRVRDSRPNLLKSLEVK